MIGDQFRSYISVNSFWISTVTGISEVKGGGTARERGYRNSSRKSRASQLVDATQACVYSRHSRGHKICEFQLRSPAVEFAFIDGNIVRSRRVAIVWRTIHMGKFETLSGHRPAAFSKPGPFMKRAKNLNTVTLIAYTLALSLCAFLRLMWKGKFENFTIHKTGFARGSLRTGRRNSPLRFCCHG